MNLPNKPKVLAATYNPVSNTKMISFLVDFPTVLLAELRTHRILTQGSLYEHMELDDFNMSANSARAIPANKYLQKVIDNPFIPIWTKKQSGMSGEILDVTTNPSVNTYWLANLNDKDTFYAWSGDGGYLCEGYESSMTEEDFEDTNIGSSSWSSYCDITTLKSNYEQLLKSDVHKQNANRLLAPFAYTTCIISGTEFENFFELRCPKYLSSDGNYYKSRKETPEYHWSKIFTEQDWQTINISPAQPEFQVIAEMLYDLYQEAEWKESKYHIPFEDEIDTLIQHAIGNGLDMTTVYNRDVEDLGDEYNQLMMKVSASMCAKLSFDTQDNEDTLEKHLERDNMFIEHKHSEPFSHQAIAMNEEDFEIFHITRIKVIDSQKAIIRDYGKCYNLTGFISQRYILENY